MNLSFSEAATGAKIKAQSDEGENEFAETTLR
jgi:hypothetical protein